MLNQLALQEEELPTAQVFSMSAETEKTKAIAEIQGAIFMARQLPRNEMTAYKKILQAAKRTTLAEKATYCYPRGGSMVKGPSIRAAETLAKYWGNIDFGIKELSQNLNTHTSEVMAYAWDLETNTRQTKTFTVNHIRVSTDKKTKEQIFTTLRDPRDIYEKVANDGARRLRACILGILPSDIVEDFISECEKTLEGNNDKPLADRIKDMLKKFEELGVTQEMIEKRMGTVASNFIAKNLVDLGAIYNSIKNNFMPVDKYFEIPTNAEEQLEKANKKVAEGKKDVKTDE